MKSSQQKAQFIIRFLWLLPVVFIIPVTGFAQNNTKQHDEVESRFNHVISGTATFLPDDTPFEGLRISFSEVGETTVGADGAYTMEVPRHWSGIATPYLCGTGGYTFDPPEIEYIDVRFDFPDQDYTGEATSIYTISGRFTDKETGEPLANTEIKFNLTGMNQAEEMYITTNDQGEYSFEKLPCWGDTLDPFLNGYFYFEPVKRGFAELGSDLTNQDFEVINYEYPVPPEWETINTGAFAFIAIENTADPDICDQPIEIGDLLGVFYTDDNGDLKCGGYTRWQDETNGFISAHGDDNTTPEKDGFLGGEPYTWKIYSYSTQKSNPASVEVATGNNVYYGLGLTKISGLDGLVENQIFIFEGWSGLSSYTMPDFFPAYITNVTDPILDELIIIQDMEKMYYPATGVNTLLFWKYHQGYKIKLSADAVLPMNGCPDADKTVDLDATWNIMPVLSACMVPVANLFEPVLDKLILVKEIGGTGIYWPEMNIQSLYMLEPGRAYFVAVSQNTSVDFTACNTSLEAGNHTSTIKNATNWNDPEETGTSHVLAISEAALKDFNPRDYIGGFTGDNICAGLAEIEYDKNLALIVFGDDPVTDRSEGFAPDEEIEFRSFNNLTGEQVKLEPVFDQTFPNNDGSFSDNGLSLITGFISAPSSVTLPVEHVHISPNPANDQVSVSMGFTGTFKLSIYDLRGRKMFQQSRQGELTLDLSDWPAGIYIIHAKGSETNQVSKLVVN